MGEIRDAMLAAAARWHDEADAEMARDNMTGRTIAVVIAEAFTQEANRYKNGDSDMRKDKITDDRVLVDDAPELAADEERWDDMRLELIDEAPDAGPNQSVAWDAIRDDEK